MKKIISFFVCLCLISGVITCGFSSVSADDSAEKFTFSRLSGGEWKSFDGVCIDYGSTVDGIRISGSGEDYYIKYRTLNYDCGDYCKYVTSRDTGEDAFSGVSGSAIERLELSVCGNDGGEITSGICVMYRVHLTRGNWLDWVSTAGKAWAEKVIATYGLTGSLDNSGDNYAGMAGKEVDGIEIRVFEEENTQTETKPSGNRVLIDAPYINQNPDYPTGCESISTVMALHYNNIDISADTFIDEYLEKGPVNDFLPDECFGGDPRSNSSYGCYAPVIKRALDKALDNTCYHATAMYGESLETLKTKYLDKGIPVIFWATMSMQPTFFTSQTSSKSDYRWIASEHCLLLVGYDDYNYYFNDPLKDKNTTYSKYAVENAYTGMKMQAVTIEKNPLGDVNMDLDINATDALATLQNAVGNNDFSAAQSYAADVDGDGEITSADALSILRYSIRLDTSFPAEQ